ncbi:FMN-dependent NADH-azoreductase [Spongiimicrobium sp. 3-5]|uniref:FMN-dependent NADH-azoreductase n=1 Tax=Spongiimicrobium sp. 3-5 TaxID=3332596 RepID=UPI00397F9943
MKKLLRIDASLRTEGSHSRALSNFFETIWKKANPAGSIIYRDLTKQQIPHLQNKTVEAFHVPEENWTAENKQAISLSNELIAELKSVDELLISSPLYNLNVPSTLKAYFDHITRSGHTFEVNTDGSYKGLLDMESVYLITTKGESYKGTSMEPLDFQEPYLKVICGFLGMKIKNIFSLEATAHLDILEKNIALAQQEIKKTLKIN